MPRLPRCPVHLGVASRISPLLPDVDLHTRVSLQLTSGGVIFWYVDSRAVGRPVRRIARRAVQEPDFVRRAFVALRPVPRSMHDHSPVRLWSSHSPLV